MRPSLRSHLDLIVFLAILAVGVLLTLLGTAASSLATISVALSGLFGAWTGTHRTRNDSHSADAARSSRPDQAQD